MYIYIYIYIHIYIYVYIYEIPRYNKFSISSVTYHEHIYDILVS